MLSVFNESSISLTERSRPTTRGIINSGYRTASLNGNTEMMSGILTFLFFAFFILLTSLLPAKWTNQPHLPFYIPPDSILSIGRQIPQVKGLECVIINVQIYARIGFPTFIIEHLNRRRTDMATIQKIHAREILDSRGMPTIEVAVYLNDGS